MSKKVNIPAYASSCLALSLLGGMFAVSPALAQAEDCEPTPANSSGGTDSPAPGGASGATPPRGNAAAACANALYQDEFNSFDPYSKTDKWRTSYHWGPETKINNEQAYYVDTENAGKSGPAGATNPFSLSNGALNITARPQSGLPNGQSYSSGVISSLGSFERTYGYYEVRAQMPKGSGFWPAFWLLRADKTFPPELDVMEYSSRLPNEYAATQHSSIGQQSPYGQKFVKDLPNLSDGFHTYGVDWQKDKVTWYFDGKEAFSVPTPSDMHSPMYMMINLAAGGNMGWIGNPDGSTQSYAVDYVRVFDSKASSQCQ